MNRKQEIDHVLNEIFLRLGLCDIEAIKKYIHEHLSEIQYEFEMEDVEDKRLFTHTVYMLVELYMKKKS